jgi:hypothetical protein
MIRRLTRRKLMVLRGEHRRQWLHGRMLLWRRLMWKRLLWRRLL